MIHNEFTTVVLLLIFSAISDTEKVGIRAKLVARFDEPIAPIATQLAVLISKIARMDCPRIWPELVPILLEAVKQPDLLAQQRALLTLHHVTKTLASKRLATDRKLFQEVSLMGILRMSKKIVRYPSDDIIFC